MRTTLCLCCLAMSLLSSAGQKPLRFSLKTSTLALTNCVANPGAVAVPLSSDETNIEIVDWKTKPSDTRHDGEFVLEMVSPRTVGCIVVYGASEVSYGVDEDWKTLHHAREKDRQLQFLVPAAGDPISRIKLKVPAQRLSGGGDNPKFQAVLPFVTLIPVRAINIAMTATVTVSSQSGLDSENPGLNRPEAIIDGVVNARSNFSTRERSTPVAEAAPEWIQLSFKDPQSVRGLVFFRGTEETGLDQTVTEAYTGEGIPTPDSEEWIPIKGMSSSPGKFRSHEFLVSAKNLDLKAIRIRATNGARGIALGELAVLSDLGYAPVPEP